MASRKVFFAIERMRLQAFTYLKVIRDVQKKPQDADRHYLKLNGGLS